MEAKNHTPSVAMRKSGFSLIETLVSVTIFSLLLTMVFSVLGSVTSVYQRTRGLTTSFQTARAAFETLKTQLTQATLQTYWDYEFPDDDPASAPTRYARYSDLHFVMEDSSDLLSGTGSGETAGDAVFFQLPGGRTDSPSLEGQLDNLLNVAGFYVEYGDGEEYEPPFIGSTAASKAGRDRYRLVQVLQPAEDNGVYVSTSAEGYDREWIRKLRIGTGGGKKDKHVLAENIVTLILRAKSGPDFIPASRSSAVTFDPIFDYDSRSWEKGVSGLGSEAAKMRNQLPPIIEIIMVAVDEASMQRMELLGKGTAPGDLGIDRFFRSADQSDVERGLESMKEKLDDLGIRYRVFRTDIALQNALWSEDLNDQ